MINIESDSASIALMTGESEMAEMDGAFQVEMGEYYYATSSDCGTSKSCGTGTCMY